MTKEAAITVHVQFATYSAPQDWLKSNVFCPNCGKQEVYMESGSGDYYVGEEYICCACESRFNLPQLVEIDKNSKDSHRQVVDQLRNK